MKPNKLISKLIQYGVERISKNKRKQLTLSHQVEHCSRENYLKYNFALRKLKITWSMIKMINKRDFWL